MKNYLMVDIESLNNTPDAVILSIGAVLFNEKGVAKDKYYAAVDIQSCLDAGLTIGGDTLLWWHKQSDEARKVFLEKTVPLKKALQGLKNYTYKHCHTYDIPVVANSPSFDCVILRNAYRAVGEDAFWKFWRELDYRTMKSLKGAPKIERGEDNVAHNALADAYAQANHTIAINKHFDGIIL